MRSRRLLYMCELPPGFGGGAPIIVKELLRGHEMERLTVLCCGRQHAAALTHQPQSLLACEHVTVKPIQPIDLRPRRFFGHVTESLDALRVPKIKAEGRRLVQRLGIEAIFTVPWRSEFAVAALLLSRETGIPLYVFETDDWEAMNPSFLPGLLARRYHGPLLRAADRAWLISPAMVDRYRERFGVEGHFLFHYIDPDRFARARAGRPASDSKEFTLLYTGAINRMFYDTMLAFCRLVNGGLTTKDERPVRLYVYGTSCPSELLGPSVTWERAVAREEIPELLVSADGLLICVTFSDDRQLMDLVTTCIYTKTIEYLAAAQPVLVVAPPYSGEVGYFGSVTTVVDSLEPERMMAGIEELAAGHSEIRRRSREGLRLVEQSHSVELIPELFLRYFESQPA